MTACPQCGRHWEQEPNYCPGCGYDTSRSIAAYGGTSDKPGSPKKEGITWGGGQVVAGIILVILTLFTAAAAAAGIGSLYPEQEDAVATWYSVHLMALGIVLTVWFLGVRHTRFPLAVLGLSGIHVPRARTVLLMVGVLATSLIATSIYAGIVAALGLDVLSPPDVESDIIFDGAAVLLTFQALAFITPLTEEIFFRGFILGGLLKRLGPWRAIAASALIFSAFHFSLGVLVPIFITGFLFGWLYWKTGSLWAAIGAHAGQNSLALAVQALQS
ncbi:MAG: CPBP family glutamic-type intramembrane protease [Chloroflexi bacterium]|nr:CPBP family glutamic-type intramembrane protease [Chloroflexota bacterium]